TSLSGLAAAIEGIEQKTLAREFSYRRKERFQVPLAVGLASLFAALVFPLPNRRRSRSGASAIRAAAALVLALLPVTARSQDASPKAPPRAAGPGPSTRCRPPPPARPPRAAPSTKRGTTPRRSSRSSARPRRGPRTPGRG